MKWDAFAYLKPTWREFDVKINQIFGINISRILNTISTVSN